MTDDRVNILNDSKKTLSKLQLLAVFFADEILYKVFLRSQVIHQLFENNAELDINKLALFHLQFTTSVIDLLKTIKKGNEKKVSLLVDEMRLNQDLINQISDARISEAEFRLEMPRQSLRMKKSLKQLYEALSNDSSDYPFAKNINTFSSRYVTNHYKSIPASLLEKLISYKPENTYSNAYAIIERKLMGMLCKYDFNVHFSCGLVSDSLIIELYRIAETNTYFIYYPSRNILLLCDDTEIADIRQNSEVEKKDNIIQDLKNQNDQLQSHITTSKVYIPNEVKQLLSDHYKKIADINFLQNLTDFDTQANILKTMLNTKII